jgi:hypothetical protein
MAINLIRTCKKIFADIPVPEHQLIFLIQIKIIDVLMTSLLLDVDELQFLTDIPTPCWGKVDMGLLIETI